VVDFMLKVEEMFGIVLDNDMILKVKTVQDVLDLIQQDTEEEAC
jgi:acyl carrier protein